MFSRILPATALVLAASQLVVAQTSTDCNPLNTTCPDDAALGGSITIDFTKGANDFFSNAEGTNISYDPTKGAVFAISKGSDAPTINSNKYIFFGKVEVVCQAAPGTGVVTSVVLESDDLDEIDWEWLGGDTANVQTDYFGKGDVSTYDRGGFAAVASPQTSFHTYTIDWTSAYVKWYVDGTLVRTLNYGDAKGGSRFPQTPMRIKLGTWDAGAEGEPEGTVQWAGGHTNFDQAPFNAYYKSITIQDYSNGVSGAKSYHWKDQSGSYQSIEVLTTGGSSSGSSSSSAAASSSTPVTSSSAQPSTSSASSTLSSVVSSSTATSANSTSATAASSGATTAATTTAASSAAQTGSATGTSSSATPSPTKSAASQTLAQLSTALFMGAALVAGLLVL